MRICVFLFGIAVICCTGCSKPSYRCFNEQNCSLNLVDERFPQECDGSLQELIQFALTYNPKVTISLSKIGIAYADLVEAGLWHNPLIEAIVRFPEKSSFHTSIELNGSFSLLDLFLIPARKKMAHAELKAAQLLAAQEILSLIIEVEETYYKLQAAQALQPILEDQYEINDISYELSKAQLQSGNINDLFLQDTLAKKLSARYAIQQNTVEIVELHEKLMVLLGFAKSCPLNIPPLTLEEIDWEEICAEEYIDFALVNRLDILAKRWELEKIRRTLKIKQWWSYTDAKAGISAEREIEGFWSRGPILEGELPIFNYGQADRMRLSAQFQQAFAEMEELENRAAADIRTALTSIQLTHQIVHNYQDELIPLRKKAVSNALDYYHVMGMGVYELLKHKEEEIVAQRDSIKALLSYRLARISLTKALGGHI